MNYDNFNTIDNKRLLWQLLYENNTFNNIPDNQLSNVKNIFEQQINFIDNNNRSLSLTEKNKKLIKQTIEHIKVFKTTKSLKPLEEVEIKISKDFQDKKEEMMNILKKPTQDEINFNEGIDNPINNEEMENILSEIIKKRNIDIEINESNESNKPKKVNFDLKDDDSNNDLIFLNKLKKKDNINDDNHINDHNYINDIKHINNVNENSYSKTINIKLDEILKNQIEILSYLRSN